MQKRHAEEHENEERWLLTYADLITLLMAFFVIMYAMSKVDANKMQQVIFALHTAFKNPPTSPTSGGKRGIQRGESMALIASQPRSERIEQNAQDMDKKRREGEKKAAAEERKRKLEIMKEQLQELVKGAGLGKSVTIEVAKGGQKLVMRMADTLLFDLGSAQLTDRAKEIMDGVGAVLSKQEHNIIIEGHTDDTPIRTARYESNWQLSTDRATHVLMYLTRRFVIPPDRLSASGYGEYRPLAPNDSAENKARNRRVEFVIFDEEIPDDSLDDVTVTPDTAASVAAPS